ncbi:MAG: hypothetical protein ACTSYR_04810 [Candidatus Odinarchaeia archaeon]
MSKKSKNDIVRVLSVIGAVLSIIFGILVIIGSSVFIGPLITIIPGLPIIEGILVIIFGIIILTSYGVIDVGPKVSHDWPILLILGVLSLIFGGDIGAVLIIIAGIVSLIQQL